MEALEADLVSQFLNERNVIFKVPAYQRPYCWLDNKHVVKLLDDIEELLINPESEHFIGTIVYLDRNKKRDNPKRYFIVDGQQRITTMYILFKALMDSLDIEADKSYINEINKTYLYYFEREIRGKKTYNKRNNQIKLELNSPDSENLCNLLNHPERINKKSHIYKNYRKIKRRIKNWLTRFSPNDIDKALKRLTFVFIALDDNDDAQKIFASLNSTGKDLEPADLVRNLLLMNRSDMEQLCKDYWIKIEEFLFREENDSTNLNDFLMHFLVSEAGKSVKKGDIYEEFGKLLKEEEDSENILNELYKSAKIYNAFLDPENSGYSLRIIDLLSWIQLTNVSTVYPVLLNVFRDYHNSVIDEKMLEEILLLLLSFLVRRQICGVGSAGLNKFFATFYRNAFNLDGKREQNYKDAFEQEFLTTSYDIKFYDDEEVSKHLAEFSLGTHTNLSRAVLLAIENQGPEHLLASNITIEHVLPQEVTPLWIEDMGGIPESEYAPYIHNLGNLILTGINSELSNRIFSEKKEMLKKNSKAVILNKDIFSENKWSVPEIRNRLERLTRLFLKAFPYPQFKTEKLIKEGLEFKIEDVDNRITGGKPISLSFNGKEFKVNTFKQLYLKGLELLYDENKEDFEGLAEIDFIPDSLSAKVLLSRDGNKINKPSILSSGIYADANFNALTLMRKLDQIRKGIRSDSEITIRFRPKNTIMNNEKTEEKYPFSKETYELFKLLRERILKLDSSVNIKETKKYIAFKSKTNFTDIIPLRGSLCLIMNIKSDEINDPQNRCEDVSDKGTWGNGDIRFHLTNEDDLEYALSLIEQALEKQK